MKTVYLGQHIMVNFLLLHSNIPSHPNPQMCIKLKIENNLPAKATTLQMCYFENKKKYAVTDLFFFNSVGTKAFISSSRNSL